MGFDASEGLSLVPVRLLAISGSLRAASSNTALLQAMSILAPDRIQVSLYDGLGTLPPFNPDLDNLDLDWQAVPEAVRKFRAAWRNSHGVLISAPEYAHGVPGTLKNALDWIVSSGETVNKPVAVINASQSAICAAASLTETLTVMAAVLVKEACLTLRKPCRGFNPAMIMADADLATDLRSALLALVRAIDVQQSSSSQLP